MWYDLKEQNVVILYVFVKPNAKQSAIITVSNDELHIALHAKPQDGAANDELIRFLSDVLRVPKTKIKLIRGKTSRHKTLQLPLNETINQFINNAGKLIR